jgi:hypothetical protein
MWVDLTNIDELYDIKADPYEIKNLIKDPQAREALEKMQAELEKLLRSTGGT